MKLKNKIIAGAAMLAFLAFSAGGLHAGVTNLLTIKATLLGQMSSTTNGSIVTAAAPAKATVTTANILNALATDEHAEAHLLGTPFPAGAKLVVIDGNGGGSFKVLDANNQVIVDVSDILSASNGKNDIFSGSQNDVTGLASTTVADDNLLIFTYDDSGILVGGAGLKFSMQGLSENKTTDTAPVAGVYTETHSSKVVDATGEGNVEGHPFVLFGSLTAAGKGTLILPP